MSKQLSAGQAYAAALRSEPANRSGLRKAQAKLRAFAQELRTSLQQSAAEWEAKYGIPYPADIDDWIRLATRAGIDVNRVDAGDWTAAEMSPIIEGYLERLKDCVAGQPPAPVKKTPKRKGRRPTHDPLVDKKLIEAYRESGLTMRQFDKEKGLPDGTTHLAVDLERKH